MINSREYQFLVELFRRPEYSTLQSQVAEVYKKDFNLFFEELLIQCFSLEDTKETLLKNILLQDLGEFIQVINQEFIPFLIDNQEQNESSEFLKLIILHENAIKELENRLILKAGFKSFERSKFKKRFQKIDEEDAITSESEIRSGIQFLERESLREKFNQIDNENHVKSSSRITIWTLSKYAAILLICFIPFYFYFKVESSSKHIALKEKNTQKKKIFTDSTKIQTIDFDLKIDSYFSQSLSVISESSQGFGKKTQTTKLSLHVLNDAKAGDVIHKLKQMKPSTKLIRGTIDSLNQIINHYRNTYVFDVQQCELYINQRFESVNKSDFEVFQIQIDEQKKYFLKVKDVYFELIETKKPLQLEILNDEEVKFKLDGLY
jgi:hypothetical protein